MDSKFNSLFRSEHNVSMSSFMMSMNERIGKNQLTVACKDSVSIALKLFYIAYNLDTRFIVFAYAAVSIARLLPSMYSIISEYV